MVYGKKLKEARILLSALAIYLFPSLSNGMPICDDFCPTVTDQINCNTANCGDTDSCTWWTSVNTNTKTQAQTNTGACQPPQSN